MNHRSNAPRLTAVALLFCAATAPIHAQACLLYTSPSPRD